MHFHGYLWVGDKAAFDQEWQRRTTAEGFTESELPPMRTAQWLLKAPRLVRGTWRDPRDAAVWLAERLEEYQPRFVSEHHADTARLAALVTAAGERLRGGGDVSWGFYLTRPQFLSLAVVACSPNRAEPGLTCPLPAGFAGR